MNYDLNLNLSLQLTNTHEHISNSYNFSTPIFHCLTIKEKNVIYNNDGSFNRVKITEDIFASNKGLSINQTIRNYLIEHIGEVYTIIESGQKVYLGNDLPNEYAFSKSSQIIKPTIKIIKGRMTTNLQEIIEHANNRTWKANNKLKHNNDGKYGFYKYNTTFSLIHNQKEKIYTGTILIRNDANGKKYLYDILNIQRKN